MAKKGKIFENREKKSKFGVIGGVSLPDTESLPLYVRLGSCSRENKRVEKKDRRKLYPHMSFLHDFWVRGEKTVFQR